MKQTSNRTRVEGATTIIEHQNDYYGIEFHSDQYKGDYVFPNLHGFRFMFNASEAIEILHSLEMIIGTIAAKGKIETLTGHQINKDAFIENRMSKDAIRRMKLETGEVKLQPHEPKT